MPEMNAFVAAWLRAQDDPRAATHERTAKSYFLQEAEGLSRWAKVQWAKLRGVFGARMRVRPRIYEYVRHPSDTG